MEIQEFFTQDFEYQPSSIEWLADIFQDDIYLKI